MIMHLISLMKSMNTIIMISLPLSMVLLAIVSFNRDTQAQKRIEAEEHTDSRYTKIAVEAWVGVIDQLNPTWISICGERGEYIERPISSVDLGKDSALVKVREGQWVVYWTRTGLIEPIRGVGAMDVESMLKRRLDQVQSWSQRRANR